MTFQAPFLSFVCHNYDPRQLVKWRTYNTKFDLRQPLSQEFHYNCD